MTPSRCPECGHRLTGWGPLVAELLGHDWTWPMVAKLLRNVLENDGPAIRAVGGTTNG